MVDLKALEITFAYVGRLIFQYLGWLIIFGVPKLRAVIVSGVIG
jgi:hypothetical protein